MSRKIKHVPGNRFFLTILVFVTLIFYACESVDPIPESPKVAQECTEPFLTPNTMAIRVQNLSMIPVDSLRIDFFSSDGNWTRSSLTFANLPAGKTGCYRVVNRTVKLDDGRRYMLDHYSMNAWPDGRINSDLSEISLKSGMYTYVVRLKREFYDYLTQVPRQEEPMNELSIRIYNVSDVDFDGVIANFYNKEIDYGPISSGEFSAYHDVDLAYRYAYLKIIVGRDTLIWQPVDYVGETPLSPSAYSFVVDKREASTMQDQGGFVLDQLRFR